MSNDNTDKDHNSLQNLGTATIGHDSKNNLWRIRFRTYDLREKPLFFADISDFYSPMTKL